MRAVLAVPAIGLLAGCAWGLHAGAPVQPLLLLPLLAAAAWAFLDNRATLVGVAVAVSFFIGGAALGADAWRAAWRPTLRLAFESMARDARAADARAERRPPLEDEASAIVVGVLESDAAAAPNNTVALRLRVQWIGRVRATHDRSDAAVNPVDGAVALTVVGTLGARHVGEWRAGRTIRAPVQLRRPARYLDPGVADQERALARRGVSLVGSVKSAALVDVVSRGSWVAEVAAAVRGFARRAIADAVGRWDPRSADIVSAIVIGDRTGLDDEVQRRLQEAGTYHVIAISGGNIAILAGFALGAFRLIGSFGRTAMLSAVGGLVGYAYLVGGGASVERATCMASVYFLGRTLDLPGPALNALALAAGLLALRDPLAIADPGFLLTFGATMAILLAAPIAANVKRWPRPAVPAVSLFCASAAAEMALMPVAASIFSRVTFAGLVLNFAAIPLMTIAQVAGMLAVAFHGAAGPIAAAAGWVAHLGAFGLVRSADLVELVPQITWRVAPPSPAVVSIYYGAGVMACALWRPANGRCGRFGRRLSSARLVATAATVGAALWILAEPWSFVRMRGDGRLHVTFLDVGQGDASLITFPRGTSMLVDGGGLAGGAGFDIGDRVVAPVLRHRGVRRLAAVALTHGDADHVGGLPSAIVEFRPPEVWEGIPVHDAPAILAVRQAASRAGSRWRNVRNDDVLTIDGVSIVVRHPAPGDWERQRIRNDDSVVIEVVWNDVSVVLTGDIGAEVERQLAGVFAPRPLRVVKVPHHGSLTSSSTVFVRALAPRAAVVSVGRGNRFGHPATAVLDRYAAAGADIFRTDVDGAVSLDTDGWSIDLSTFTGRRTRLAVPLARP